jgi:hypothetical protein
MAQRKRQPSANMCDAPRWVRAVNRCANGVASGNIGASYCASLSGVKYHQLGNNGGENKQY